MNDASASDIVQGSGIYDIIDEAKVAGRLSLTIDRALWERLYPAARQLCGTAFRQMFQPWRSFMFDGMWIEREKCR